MARTPLGASTYLFRNATKTLPLIGVIVLAVMLVAGIVSLINSIPLSIRTIYQYSRHYVGVTPRGDAEMTQKNVEILKSESPVELDRMILLRGGEVEVKSIVGPWPFVILALKDEDMSYYLKQMKVEKLDGRVPKSDAPEALISEPVARNLGLKLGDILMSPENSEAYSPQDVRIVGIAQTSEWLGLMGYEYHTLNHFPPIDSVIAFAKNRDEQKQLDAWALKRFNGQRARVFAYSDLERQANSMFSILYQILNVVISMLVIVITVMMGMLINIFLGQRVQEFGLLQALGYPKSSILWRVISETSLVVAGGWALGLCAAYGTLNLVKQQLMEPRAFALDVLDRTAYLYTIPIPIAIFAVSVLAVVTKFNRYDPVGIVERRLV